MSDSPYGTFDQGGNVWEWTETPRDSSWFAERGGSYYTHDFDLHANLDYAGGVPTFEGPGVGFRVVSIPNAHGDGGVHIVTLDPGEIEEDVDFGNYATYLAWDKADDGSWEEPHWLDPSGNLFPGYPDGNRDAVIRTNHVTVATDQSVRNLTVESGQVVVAESATLMLVGGFRTTDVSQAGGPDEEGLIAGEGSVRLEPGSTLWLEAADFLGDLSQREWGDYTRTIITGNVSGTFTNVPPVAPAADGGGVGHLGHGVFLTEEGPHGQGVTHGANIVEVDLFQAAPGDTDGDRDVDISDIMNILAEGKFGIGPSNATWPEGDVDGDKDVDISDIMKILAAGLFDTGSYAPVALVNGQSAGHDLVTSLANLRMRNQLLSIVLDAKKQELATFRTHQRDPLPSAKGPRLGQDAPSTGSPLAHDTVLERAVNGDSNGRKTSLGKITWLYDLDQMNTKNRPVKNNKSLEEAVDRLWAMY